MQQPPDGGYHHPHRPHQQDAAGKDTAQHRKAGVAVGVGGVCLPLALALEKPRHPDAQRIPQIVHRVGEDGHAAGEHPTEKLKHRKSQIEQKRDEYVAFGFHSFTSLTNR